mmetsp:Transcript_25367/g.58988  ORF Transcript_25367/g.58988 Transcript_25367/m.58988 type:complete len:378 (-) Transcript_25367:206-1339(-)
MRSVFVVSTVLVLSGTALGSAPTEEVCSEMMSAGGQCLMQRNQRVEKQNVALVPEYLVRDYAVPLPSLRQDASSAATKRSGVPAEMQAIFDRHNVFRCMHDVPLLHWDDSIAAHADAWASAGVYGHGTQAERTLNGVVLGENLAVGYPTRTGVDSVQAWYDEITETVGGTPSSCDDKKPNSTEAICHYTQVVWEASTHIGCGKGRANVTYSTGVKESDYWVCQYSPAGNVGGQFTANVKAAVKSEEDCAGATPPPLPVPEPTTPPPAIAPTPAPSACWTPMVDGAAEDSPHICQTLGGDPLACVSPLLSCSQLSGMCSQGFVKNKCLETCNYCPPCEDGGPQDNPIINGGMACADLSGFCGVDFVAKKCSDTCGQCP